MNRPFSALLHTFAFAAISGLACACSVSDGSVQIDSTGDGKTFSAAMGQEIEINLSDGGDGGYLWSVEDTGGLGGGGATHHAGNGSIGDSGTDTFTFVATTAGSHIIVLKDQQPWETSPLMRFSVTIVVAAAPAG